MIMKKMKMMIKKENSVQKENFPMKSTYRRDRLESSRKMFCDVKAFSDNRPIHLDINLWKPIERVF